MKNENQKHKKKKTVLELAQTCDKSGFDPCPFCGKRPRLGVHDDEGNFKGFPEDDRAVEYIDDPWSGLSFRIWHPDADCPICTEDPHESGGFGGYCASYDTPDAAAKDWNDRS